MNGDASLSPFMAAQLVRWASPTPRLAMESSLRLALLLLCVLVATISSAAQMAPPDRTRENLMVVVRESIGANRTEDRLSPTGKVKARLADGREIEMEMASWEFIGDTHIRFVFDGPTVMVNATPQDLQRLGIASVDDALAVAIDNVRRVYGEPQAVPWEGGLMQVRGRSSDLDSSYFLDRAYWQSLLRSHPDGIVVSVAKRGGLLYAPLSDTRAVEGLKRGVTFLHHSSERLRISSALYLFKDGKWSAFQAPAKQ